MKHIKQKYTNCEKCKTLYKNRHNVVFGEGNKKSKIVFVGEAPGKNEDLRGSPFVGQAGKVLNKHLETIKLTREEIYITNVVKCRPPNNRNPLSEEIANCSCILEEELSIIKPKIIVPLGLFATKYFLNINKGMGDLQGQIFMKKDTIILPMYHPAYILRNPNAKIEFVNSFVLLDKSIKL